MEGYFSTGEFLSCGRGWVLCVVWCVGWEKGEGGGAKRDVELTMELHLSFSLSTLSLRFLPPSSI